MVTWEQTFAQQHPFAPNNVVKSMKPRARKFNPSVTGSPINTVAPLLTGSLPNGSVLTCAPGTWKGTPPPTFTYQWYSGPLAVGTGTSSYTTVSTDVGNAMTCRVLATNTGGSMTAMSNPIGPVT